MENGDAVTLDVTSGIPERALQKRDAVHVPNVARSVWAHDGRYQQVVDGLPTKSILCRPVVDNEGVEVIAVIMLVNKLADGVSVPFNEDDRFKPYDACATACAPQNSLS